MRQAAKTDVSYGPKSEYVYVLCCYVFLTSLYYVSIFQHGIKQVYLHTRNEDETACANVTTKTLCMFDTCLLVPYVKEVVCTRQNIRHEQPGNVTTKMMCCKSKLSMADVLETSQAHYKYPICQLQ